MLRFRSRIDRYPTKEKPGKYGDTVDRRKLSLLATYHPTIDELEAVIAPMTADTVIQILRGDGIYRGWDAERHVDNRIPTYGDGSYKNGVKPKVEVEVELGEDEYLDAKGKIRRRTPPVDKKYVPKTYNYQPKPKGFYTRLNRNEPPVTKWYRLQPRKRRKAILSIAKERNINKWEAAKLFKELLGE